MKTADLEGSKLAEWVARANGMVVEDDGGGLICWENHGKPYAVPHSFGPHGYRPDLNWAQGGPIIEREQIGLLSSNQSPCREWQASYVHPDYTEHCGKTPLIAAMRCFVYRKIGSEVPDL